MFTAKQRQSREKALYNLRFYYISPSDYEEAEQRGIEKGTLWYRVRQLGWNIDKAIKTPVRKKEDTGWDDYKGIATRNGVKYATYHRRIKSGWSQERAAVTPVRKSS